MSQTLAWPIRFENGALATVEIDSLDEVTQNVAILADTPPGFYVHDPDIGTPDWLFDQLPVDTTDFEAQVARHEDRAVLVVDDNVDDALIAVGRDTVGIHVYLADGA